MADQSLLIALIAETAGRWSDPDFGARREAVDRTLSCDNVFTSEAIEFAIDQQMSELTEPKLHAWVQGRQADHPGTVAVLGAGNVPFVDLQDWLAVTLSGHAYVGVSSSRSPYLLKAFAESVRQVAASRETSVHKTSVQGTPGRFVDLETALRVAEWVIATGADDTVQDVQKKAIEAGIAENKMLLRGSGFGVAVVTGNESADAWLDLAEDCLLHEGRGCRNAAIVFAPEHLAPDGFLAAAATFRGVFPAHPRTAGGLAIPKAMLEALGQSCAYADDLSFLVSAGEPEVKEPCHIRWASYKALSEVGEWLNGQGRTVQVVLTSVSPELLWPESDGADGSDGSDELDRRLVSPIGSAQHPSINWCPDGVDTIDFLCGATT